MENNNTAPTYEEWRDQAEEGQDVTASGGSQISPEDPAWTGDPGVLPPRYRIDKLGMPLVLPCGYMDEHGLHRDVVLAPMTGVEEDLLSDEELAADGTNIRRIVANCITRVGSAFQVPQSGSERKRTQEEQDKVMQIVDRLTLGDSAFLLVMLRRLSHPDMAYKFPAVCPNSICGEDFTVTFDLAQLVVQNMPEPSVRQHTARLPSGKSVRYRHLYNFDQVKLHKLKQLYPKHYQSCSLWAHLISADGHKISSWRDIQHWSAADRNALREEQQRMDGGIEIDRVSIRCPKCSHRWVTGLEIGPSFFLPSLESRSR